MRTRAGAYIVYSQLSLLVFMSLCIALHPGLVLKWNEAGLSNYGIHIKTIVPYTLALGLCALFAMAAARSLRAMGGPATRMRNLLNVYGGLMLLLLLSTYGYTLNAGLKNAHIVLNIVTILFEFGAALWMYSTLPPSKAEAAWLGVLSVGLSLAVIDFFKLLHVLFTAQTFIGMGFGVLVVHAVRHCAGPGQR